MPKTLPFLILCFGLTAACQGPGSHQDPDPGRGPAPGRGPNIVLILADDMGYGDAGCYNDGAKIPTPHLDRLARQGRRLTDAHSPSSVCTPTRYGILTGRYAWRTGLKRSVLWPWDPPLIAASRQTLPEVLRDHGYQTACIGKWHLGWDWPMDGGRRRVTELIGGRVSWPRRQQAALAARVAWDHDILGGPLEHGFDEYFGDDVPNFPPYTFIKDRRVVRIPSARKPKGMFGIPGAAAPGWKLEEVLPELSRRAQDYLRTRAQEPNQPFFLYLPLTAPHTPIAPALAFRGKSQAGAYGDFVHQVDDLVGRVMKTLDDQDLAEDTVLIFTSDNGSPQRDGRNAAGAVGSVKRRFGHDPSRPWRGLKADIWEGGHRVPFLIRWPDKVPAGSVGRNPLVLTDLYRSLLSIAGARVPRGQGEDSFDQQDQLCGAPAAECPRDHLVHHSSRGTFAIRQGPWKLILGQGSGGFSRFRPPAGAPAGQLYHLGKDPGETDNRYLREPAKVRQLQSLLEKIRSQGHSQK